MASVFQQGKIAVITGAASGVGFATARLCRQRGMHLALIDYDQVNVHKARDILAGMNGSLKTKAYHMDVGDRDAWATVGKDIAASFDEIDLLVLNAGRSLRLDNQQEGAKIKRYMDLDYWQKTLSTNLFGPLNGLEVLLPLVLSSKSKTPKSVVFTGSKQGITNPPGGANPAYNSSKAAVKNLAEHLAHDLRSDPNTAHVSAHLLIPGWTWTGLMGNAGPTEEAEVQKPQGAWYPSQVANELEKGLQRGSFYVICPDGETDAALDQARMKWATDDICEDRPALSRWDEKWKKPAEEWIQAEAKRRR